MRPDLSIIVVSYESAPWLVACLESVQAHAGTASLEVIVVDNGSTDGSPEMVARHFPQARVVRSENRGFAHGNNRGLDVAAAPFILFLNPDTRILEGTFGEMLDYMECHPRVGLAGCRQLAPDGSLQLSIRRFPTARRSLFESLGSEHFPFRASWLGERELDPATYDREFPCDWTSGSFMLTRREALRDAGPMDDRYFMYYEEPDLCLRFKRAGWDVRHVPEMTIEHHAGKAGPNVRLAAQEAYARRQYILKNHRGAHRALSILASALGYALRAAGPSTRHDPAERRACARAALLAVLGATGGPFRTEHRDSPGAAGSR